METKNIETAPVGNPGVRKPVLTKQDRAVYKFSKKSGKNCGPVRENEQRDRNLYDYSDEM
ncbi:MAG TPA: hypothetical protein VFH31_04310 [Pyrinomonadaceae bacterium]|nr:hypothetical protein [Pyrinomonadaceae bacterium]